MLSEVFVCPQDGGGGVDHFPSEGDLCEGRGVTVKRGLSEYPHPSDRDPPDSDLPEQRPPP